MKFLVNWFQNNKARRRLIEELIITKVTSENNSLKIVSHYESQ
jgi:hypothetical protein